MAKVENGKPLIDTELTRRGALVLRAIDHPLRLRIIQIINRNSSTSVTKLYKQLKIEQSAVSAHLKILRDAGFVRPQRRGKMVCYQVVPEQLKTVQRLSALLLDYKPQHVVIWQPPKKKIKVVKHHTFTEQEKKIIELICSQNTNEEIAEKMGLGKRTVEGYRDMIIEKMEVRNTAGLVVYAIKRKLYKI